MRKRVWRQTIARGATNGSASTRAICERIFTFAEWSIGGRLNVSNCSHWAKIGADHQ